MTSTPVGVTHPTDERQAFLNALAWLSLFVIYGGYALYLAHMYSTTGGYW